jgi:epoxide hydrolase-like predicted phosphatase
VRPDAVFFDLGGVILRTEYEAPREYLAGRLGLPYEDLVRIVFESDTARQASLGQIGTQQHWEAVAARLGRPADEVAALRDQFFGGDVLDRQLLDFIRSLRSSRRTGLISNGWPDLRDYITRNRFEDAFDVLIISAEVGLMKPDHRIYELALQHMQVSPGQSVMVDDMPANVAAAKDLGMHGIVFKDATQVQRELNQILR